MKVVTRAANLYKENFQNESFFGQKWLNVCRRTHPPKCTKYLANSQRKILTGRTSNLGRSIRWRIEDRTAIVYSDLIYSRVHNDGVQGVGRKHRARIPQQQFIGLHKQIDDMVKATIASLKHIDTDWGQLNLEQPPVKFPCALVSIASDNVQETKPRDLRNMALKRVNSTIHNDGGRVGRRI